MFKLMTPQEQELMLANNGLSLMLFYLNTLYSGTGTWRGTVIADGGPPYIHIHLPNRKKVCFIDVHHINKAATYQIRSDKEENSNPYCIASDIGRIHRMMLENEI